MDRNAPVGVFDSGVGGLTVAREIMRQIPDERIIYFGDTARLPYGSKSRDTIIRYSRQIIRFLRAMEVKAIVIACNTDQCRRPDSSFGYPQQKNRGDWHGRDDWQRHLYRGDAADAFGY